MRTPLAAATLLLATAAAAQQLPAAGPAAMPAGPGRAQVQAACSGCHELGTVTAQHYSRAKWSEVVADMAGRGAPLDDADHAAVVAYLSKHYGERK